MRFIRSRELYRSDENLYFHYSGLINLWSRSTELPPFPDKVISTFPDKQSRYQAQSLRVCTLCPPPLRKKSLINIGVEIRPFSGLLLVKQFPCIQRQPTDRIDLKLDGRETDDRIDLKLYDRQTIDRTDIKKTPWVKSLYRWNWIANHI